MYTSHVLIINLCYFAVNWYQFVEKNIRYTLYWYMPCWSQHENQPPVVTMKRACYILWQHRSIQLVSYETHRHSVRGNMDARETDLWSRGIEGRGRLCRITLCRLNVRAALGRPAAGRHVMHKSGLKDKRQVGFSLIPDYRELDTGCVASFGCCAGHLKVRVFRLVCLSLTSSHWGKG